MANREKIKILLIEDEEFDVKRVRRTIEPFSQQIEIVDVVSDGLTTLQIVKERRGYYDVIIMDYQIAGGMHGEELIRKIKEIDPLIQIIIITKMTINITDFQFARHLMDAGAMWYCTKYPADIDDYIYQPTDFILSIFNAYEKKKLMQKELKTRGKLEEKLENILIEKEIIGRSAKILELKYQIEQIARTDATVVIRGESGTGKELAATHIHYLSQRKFENFVTINCGSIPRELIESELFGYEKGAFTGARDRKLGLFEIAHNGTIFLDEIAELPPEAQVKLLRVLQEGEIDKIGRKERIKVNVRVIAATNKNLEEEVSKGNFREDLYYRINVFTLWIPPLRERKEDIPLFIDYFMDKYSRQQGITKPEILPEAMEELIRYSWPGNVRELQNVVQRLLIFANHAITIEDVKNSLYGIQMKSGASKLNLDEIFRNHLIPLKEFEEKFRKEYIMLVRKRTKSDAEAAHILGIAPPNFSRLCKKLGIK